MTIKQVQWNLYKADTIGAKKSVRFIEIFSKIVWPQSKAIRSLSYFPSYRCVRFKVCPLYRDSTVFITCSPHFLFEMAAFTPVYKKSKMLY